MGTHTLSSKPSRMKRPRLGRHNNGSALIRLKLQTSAEKEGRTRSKHDGHASLSYNCQVHATALQRLRLVWWWCGGAHRCCAEVECERIYNRVASSVKRRLLFEAAVVVVATATWFVYFDISLTACRSPLTAKYRLPPQCYPIKWGASRCVGCIAVQVAILHL